jgi:flagellar biosynthesis protein FliR
LFCAEIVLGLLSKAAPQMNVLQFGFALKILIVLLLAGVALPALPDAVGRLLERVVSGDIFVSP